MKKSHLLWRVGQKPLEVYYYVLLLEFYAVNWSYFLHISVVSKIKLLFKIISKSDLLLFLTQAHAS